MLCQFTPIADGWCQCIRCPNRLRSTRPERCVARCRAARRDVLAAPCLSLGAPTGETTTCAGCPGSRRAHALFACARHGTCLPLAQVRGVPCCETCAQYLPKDEG